MSKEQHIDEPFTMMICKVVNIIYCLSTVIGHEQNLLFSYRPATTNQTLLRMVLFLMVWGFLKLPYAYVLHYRVSIHVWFLLYGNHTRMVLFYIYIWVFQIRCPYRYYTLTIPESGPIFNDTCMVSKQNHHTSMGSRTGRVMPVHAKWFCVYGYIFITHYLFIKSLNKYLK